MSGLCVLRIHVKVDLKNRKNQRPHYSHVQTCRPRGRKYSHYQFFSPGPGRVTYSFWAKTMQFCNLIKFFPKNVTNLFKSVIFSTIKQFFLPFHTLLSFLTQKYFFLDRSPFFSFFCPFSCSNYHILFIPSPLISFHLFISHFPPFTKMSTPLDVCFLHCSGSCFSFRL